MGCTTTWAGAAHDVKPSVAPASVLADDDPSYILPCTTKGGNMMAHRHGNDKVTKTEKETWLRLGSGRSLVKYWMFSQH